MGQATLEYFQDLQNWDIDLVQPDPSGGRIDRASIDTIAAAPRASTLIISGLHQDTFEYLVERYGGQFRAIYFYKCPRVEDLSKLEKLDSLEYLLYYWNQKAHRLWDLTRNIRLKGLQLRDFRHLHRLDEVARCATLETLWFDHSVWNRNALESLGPLSSMNALRSLVFSAEKIADDDVAPLTSIRNLQALYFPSKLFTTEQVAYLTAHLKKRNVVSDVLQAYRVLEQPIGDKDCLVIGKRKPFLNRVRDRRRLEKYIRAFDEQVRHFEQDLKA